MEIALVETQDFPRVGNLASPMIRSCAGVAPGQLDEHVVHAPQDDFASLCVRSLWFSVVQRIPVALSVLLDQLAQSLMARRTRFRSLLLPGLRRAAALIPIDSALICRRKSSGSGIRR